MTADVLRLAERYKANLDRLWIADDIERNQYLSALAFNNGSLMGQEATPCWEQRYNEYSCGCKERTRENGKYYDHACASCHRHNWTRGTASRVAG